MGTILHGVCEIAPIYTGRSEHPRLYNIGVILHRGMQNFYIYRTTNLISVKLYITVYNCIVCKEETIVIKSLL